MADHHHHHDASISINGRSRGSSKAQLSLQKILQTISSTYQIQAPPIPHHQSPASASSSSLTSSSSSSVLINVSDEMMGPAVNLQRNNVGSSLHFDLNLSPPPEEEEQVEFSDQTHHKESQSPVVNASDGEGVQENDNERILEVGPEEEDGTDYSDQTHHRESQFPVGNAGDGGAIQEDNNERVLEVGPEEQKQDEEEDEKKRQRRLAALLDAVRIVSGDDGPSEPTADNRSTATSAATDHELARNPRLHLECEEEEKVQTNAAAEDEEEPVAKEKVLAAVTETAVVRTKRGRAQVLPNKYRDSFVEPITNLSSRHNRSSSSSKHVPSKRRSTR